MVYFFTEEQKTCLLEWATELEETQLPQGKGNLRTEIGYCCLGIYCNMRGPESWIRGAYSPGGSIYAFEKEESRLPLRLSKELGIESFQNLFMTLNDGWGYSFKQIAVEIRSLVETGDWGIFPNFSS